MKKGFTLPEILVAVMVVAILVAMAVPQYEKAVEKSRKAEVLSTLKKLHESKMRMLDAADMLVYQDGFFGMENLDFSPTCVSTGSALGHQVKCSTKDFDYYLRPTSGSTDQDKNSVCAKRNSGDYAGTVFIYYGDLETRDADLRFICSGSGCDVFGMTGIDGLACP